MVMKVVEDIFITSITVKYIFIILLVFFIILDYPKIST